MKPKTGRCAILFPHGVLFRNEEKEMREKLVRSNLLDCVIGLGPNLFYNSPMEACIVICRTKKPDSHNDKVLFINAVNEVTRKNAESYLEKHHIDRIKKAYESYGKDDPELARAVSIREIEKNNFSLSIPLYVKDPAATVITDNRSVSECYTEWKNSSEIMHKNYDEINKLLLGGGENE